VDVTVSNMVLAGVAIDPAATYQVTVNNFLVDGGDRFFAFAEVDTSLRIGGGDDLAALIDYFGVYSPVAPPGTDRANETFDVTVLPDILP
jgi:5'-nucleotidase